MNCHCLREFSSRSHRLRPFDRAVKTRIKGHRFQARGASVPRGEKKAVGAGQHCGLWPFGKPPGVNTFKADAASGSNCRFHNLAEVRAKQRGSIDDRLQECDHTRPEGRKR